MEDLLDSPRRPAGVLEKLFCLSFVSDPPRFSLLPLPKKKQDLTVSVSDLIVYSIFSIGYFLMAFTDQKQVLHDRMAGCLVVNK